MSLQSPVNVPASAPKLSEIAHVLHPIAYKYFEVGVQLDVSVDTLHAITEENSTISRRLCKTIHSWQNNSSTNSCTWSTLADAVARVGGHDKLVREIRARDGGNNAPNTRAESEEDAGYSTISDSPISDTESSSGSDIERFELVPGCGCGKEMPCSLYTLCARGCPNPTRRRIPVLQKKRVGAVTQDDLPFEDEDDCEDFERETKKIQKLFGKFVTDVCCSFENQKVNIEKLALFLQTSLPVMKPRSKELNQATCLEQIFKIVADQACSWFDYEVIKDMIDYFGDSSDKHRAQVYEEEFRKYANQRLPKGKKHIEIGSGAKVSGMQLVVKIDKEWEEVNFNDLDKLRSSFASILGVRRRELYLADVREGCIMMTFMIQKELGKKLFPTKSCLTTEQIHSLKSESVISLRCGKLTWRASTTMASERGEKPTVSGRHENEMKMSCLTTTDEVHNLTSTWKKSLKLGLTVLMALILLSTSLAGASLILWQSVSIPQVYSRTDLTGDAAYSGITDVSFNHTLGQLSSCCIDQKVLLARTNIRHIKGDHNGNTKMLNNECRHIMTPANLLNNYYLHYNTNGTSFTCRTERSILSVTSDMQYTIIIPSPRMRIRDIYCRDPFFYDLLTATDRYNELQSGNLSPVTANKLNRIAFTNHYSPTSYAALTLCIPKDCTSSWPSELFDGYTCLKSSGAEDFLIDFLIGWRAGKNYILIGWTAIAEDLIGWSEAEDLIDLIVAEDIIGWSEAEDLIDRIVAEDIIGWTEAEDLIDCFVAEDILIGRIRCRLEARHDHINAVRYLIVNHKLHVDIRLLYQNFADVTVVHRVCTRRNIKKGNKASKSQPKYSVCPLNSKDCYHVHNLYNCYDNHPVHLKNDFQIL